MSNLAEQMAGWIRRQVEEAGTKGVVIGLSGGVDSAVVARVSQMAMGDAVLTVIMPAHSNHQDEQDARLVAERFKLPVVAVDLTAAYDTLDDAVGQALEHRAGNGGSATVAPPPRLAQANIKPRLRMTTLYAIANRYNYIVAGTGNRSELAIGYFTKYGDGGVDVLPLGDLVKGEVWALARDLGVPTGIIDKAPSAGLWSGQTDEGEMGFSYGDLDRYLHDGASAVDEAIAERIGRLVRVSEHKRRLPPVFEPDRSA